MSEEMNQKVKDKEEEKEKKRKLLIVLLIIGIVICLIVTIWALFFRDGGDPDYPPLGIEANQIPVDDDNSNKLESPVGGGAINVTYGTTATVSLSNGTVTLYYANPNASNQNVTIALNVGDLTVAKSELINPGNKVTELKIEENAKSMLKVGGYNAELVISAFDPDSGEKAMVDTKGELTLKVTK